MPEAMSKQALVNHAIWFKAHRDPAVMNYGTNLVAEVRRCWEEMASLMQQRNHANDIADAAKREIAKLKEQKTINVKCDELKDKPV